MVVSPATCILLVIQAVVSFRSVPRIFSVLNIFHQVPHFTSIINWTLRLGLARLNAVAPRIERWIAIIDCSIDIGMSKALVVLRVNLDSQADQVGALTLEDCECIGVRTNIVWNGELVAEALKNIFKTSGDPVAILKDEGGDLRRGVRLWNESQEKKVFQINDIGHFSANALKAEYDNQSRFREMLNIVTRLSSQLKHSTLGYLMAPSLGHHNRFFRVFKISHWCEQMLDLMSKNQISFDNVSCNIKGNFLRIKKLRSFLERFSKSCNITVKALEILKNQGLNQSTYDQVLSQIKSLSTKSIVRKRFQKWLDEHLQIQKDLGMDKIPLPVSSDIIESLMGQFKTIIQRCPRGEFNRMILAFPNLCGKLTEENIQSALRQVRHIDLQAWEKENVQETLRQARRKVLPQKIPEKQVPKTGKAS